MSNEVISEERKWTFFGIVMANLIANVLYGVFGDQSVSGMAIILIEIPLICVQTVISIIACTTRKIVLSDWLGLLSIAILALSIWVMFNV